MFRTELKVRFTEGYEAFLIEPLEYVHHKHGKITVPKGFKTDFASVPGFVLLPGIVPRVGRIRWAAVVHDYLYRTDLQGMYSRKQADDVFYDAAIEQGLPKWRALIAYAGVRIGGWASWNS